MLGGGTFKNLFACSLLAWVGKFFNMLNSQNLLKQCFAGTGLIVNISISLCGFMQFQHFIDQVVVNVKLKLVSIE